jgi:hypothetical protein
VIEEEFLRVYTNLLDRISGPLHLRLLIQPLMAVILASIAGVSDARAGKTPYFWGLINDPAHRREMLANGWHSVGKLFVVALVLDCLYQYIALRFIWPGEAIIVAIVLAIFPYLLVRGAVTRLLRKPA